MVDPDDGGDASPDIIHDRLETPAATPAPALVRSEGYLARRDPRASSIGLMLAIAIHAAGFAALLFRWHQQVMVVPPSPPLVVTMLPLAAPPEPVRELPPGPEQQEREEARPNKPRPIPPQIVIPRDLMISNPLPPTPSQRDPGPPAPETTAPKSMPAPPARQMASNAARTWEAELLAHLEKYRRYPGGARARREQGVVHVTFRMNRAGRVLTSHVGKSSGSVALDQAALATLKRAQPLPPIPEDRPNELTLSVLIEFFLQ